LSVSRRRRRESAGSPAPHASLCVTESDPSLAPTTHARAALKEGMAEDYVVGLHALRADKCPVTPREIDVIRAWPQGGLKAVGRQYDVGDHSDRR
jgi:hypothetical protein